MIVLLIGLLRDHTGHRASNETCAGFLLCSLQRKRYGFLCRCGKTRGKRVAFTKPQDSAAATSSIREFEREIGPPGSSTQPADESAVGRGPIDTLREGIASSDPCWAVLAGRGALIALFGVVPDAGITRSGMIWLLGSDELAKHRFAVLRWSHLWVARLHERYDHLWNYIDARNDVHMNWLRSCGFRFVQLVECHGFEERPFWKIERTRVDSCGFDCLKTRGD